MIKPFSYRSAQTYHDLATLIAARRVELRHEVRYAGGSVEDGEAQELQEAELAEIEEVILRLEGPKK